ncbi:ThuA domain-containing protein [Mucilaginibacter sp. BJC16-A38]|uniref:ThuA domain-containing protein n=1 Tax=Mucilaginibacter phenanthrenivorans TaxID=1234842 RepID=UPI00215722E0|nr:ThuA domain-containing protein [Mucilaginibacter phenanthrenivorans]MCR8560709.1 ThuA domain-containing protein [Mucilaginibacter phenanthrenivorans]
MNRRITASFVSICSILLCVTSLCAQSTKPKFKVIAFYTAQEDKAHISFVHEANAWFPKMATKYNFAYDSTKNWSNLNPEFLSHYQVVLFLDTRPDDPAQRKAFENYMKNGGAWMGFHFSAFALTPSKYNQDWDWYHKEFLGSGQYVSNIWRPSPAILDVDTKFPATKHLPKTFKTSPNEWYRWEYDLRKNPDIRILASIDSASYPLGTGPKQSEIWHSGYYPVVWTNTKYKMVYFNMGHNDMDYEHKYDNTDKTLSYTFSSPMEAKMVLDALMWLGGVRD